jgi:hypothetical protein
MLKPSPEREGKRGTKEWWYTTLGTIAKFVGVPAVALTVAVSLPSAHKNEAPDPMKQENVACITYDRYNQIRTMHGVASVSIGSVCEYSRPPEQPAQAPALPVAAR